MFFSLLVSPHDLLDLPTSQSHHPSQQIHDKQQQQIPLTNTESIVVRSATIPPLTPASKTARLEIEETDELSTASLDFAHTNHVDIPGSWKYRSLPNGRPVSVKTTTKRHRAPIPRSFLDSQQYPSDSEQIVRSYSFRHPQRQEKLLEQSHPFGSIPTINR